MAETLEITEELAEELELPYACLDYEVFDESRWGLWKRGWFEHDGKFWQIEWEEGATEMQDDDAYENFPQTAKRVEKRQVTVEKWVAV